MGANERLSLNQPENARASSPLGNIVWLPVLLAASFPIGAVTAWAASEHPPAERAESGSQNPAIRLDGSPQAASRLTGAFTEEVRHWTPEITRWALQYELPAELIATVMQIESCGHPQVSSPAGALGLFQVMPFHFDAMDDPFLPATNAARGLSYLSRSLLLARGDVGLALAGYNGGHSVIARSPSAWPNETLRYVHWGTQILHDVERELSPSPGVQAWLAAGGAALCARAADFLGTD
jgi:soluble lytic murein transglycosylase-like protein